MPYDAQKTLIDLVATYIATDALTVIVSYGRGKQKQHANGASELSWNGAAWYADYAIRTHLRTSVRLEYLDDKHGFNTGTKQTLKEATMTFGYDPIKSFSVW